MLVRAATAADFPAIQSIYAHHVLHGLASFEETPPSVEEMRSRYDDIVARGLPYLAAEEAGEVLGYGYCSLYRTRSGYRHTLEDSVYVRAGQHRKGIGKKLLRALIEHCEQRSATARSTLRSACTRASVSCAPERCAPSASSSAAGSTA
jgi:phosphinothricin acetyltransferase